MVAGAVFVGDEFFAEFVGLHEVVVEVPHLEDSMKHLCGALGWGGELTLGCQTVMGRRGARSVLGLIGVLGSGRGRWDGGGMKTGFRVKAPE